MLTRSQSVKSRWRSRWQLPASAVAASSPTPAPLNLSTRRVRPVRAVSASASPGVSTLEPYKMLRSFRFVRPASLAHGMMHAPSAPSPSSSSSSRLQKASRHRLVRLVDAATPSRMARHCRLLGLSAIAQKPSAHSCGSCRHVTAAAAACWALL
ncbi:hypothetical protein COO60DRAFT_1574989 [Scenedesmus sp. NREL 46B-D3]|nr:hypothetical protein COO60DRAFT_1574989 [Scenedesmus sp. NREL 46B-D3]